VNTRERAVLVILSNAEQHHSQAGAVIRCGFETQMDEIAGRFQAAFLYSPVVDEAFDGYAFQSRVECRALCHGMHRSSAEFPRFVIPYLRGLFAAMRRHRDTAVFLVYVPDSYIGVLALLVGRILRVQMICRVTNDLVSEFATRRPTPARRWLASALRRPFNSAVGLLLRGRPTFFTGSLFMGDRPEFFPITSCSLRRSDIPGAVVTRDRIRNVLFVGRFDDNKGWRYFLEAAKRSSSDLIFHIVGFGTLAQEAEVQSAVREAALGPRIRLHGFVPFGPALFAHLKAADVLVVPSVNEYQGKTHFEGMAFGCCVVATDVPGITDYVRHEENGLLVSPRDGGAIATAIVKLQEEPALRARLVSAGYKAAQGLTVEAMNDFIVDRARAYGALEY